MSVRERRKRIDALIMKLIWIIPAFLVVVVVLLLNSCTDEKEAQRILTANGYTEIEYTGHSWFGCSEDDTYATGFTAKTQTGQEISGAVCSGILFKNSTIRFN